MIPAVKPKPTRPSLTVTGSASTATTSTIPSARCVTAANWSVASRTTKNISKCNFTRPTTTRVLTIHPFRGHRVLPHQYRQQYPLSNCHISKTPPPRTVWAICRDSSCYQWWGKAKHAGFSCFRTRGKESTTRNGVSVRRVLGRSRTARSWREWCPVLT